MKNYLIFTILLASSFALVAQVPHIFNYQAVARDADGLILAEQELNVEFTIHKSNPSGEVAYREQHTCTTNQFGLFTLNIGSGSVITGDFSSVDWGNDQYFIAVEMNGVLMGTSQLLSVPYAIHARTVEEDQIDDADADPLNEIQRLSLTGTELTLSNGGGTVEIPGDNWGIQTVMSDATLSGGGTGGDPLGVVGDLTDDQTLSLVGNELSIADGNSVNLPTGVDDWGTQVVESDATLTGNGTEFSPLGIADDGVTSQKIEDGTIAGSDLADHAVTVLQLPIGATANTYLRGDGTWSIPATGSGDETDPTWNGDANQSVSIGRTGRVGIGTTSPAALLHTNGTGTGQGNVLFEGEYKTSNPADPPASGGGTRMMWYPDKGAFRAGQVSNTQWDAANIGGFSVAMGIDTEASGLFSIAFGSNTNASETFSSAMGAFTNASGNSSTALGNFTQASGDYAISTGYGTEASGNYSTAMGSETSASGIYSTSLGYQTTAWGAYSLAMGLGTDAHGMNTIAMGRHTVAPSHSETVIGSYNTVYTPLNTTTWNANDRLFTIGNGSSASTRSNALTILKNGRIGIGIDIPSFILDVEGDRISLRDDTGDWIALRADGSADFLDITYSGGSLAIQGSTAGENIVLNPSRANRVGIRTWIPAYELDVNGSIRATGSVYYGGTSGNADGTAYTKPDYVFEESYERLTTEEVDGFLRKEKHLPWMTSAEKEKEENGEAVDMTRMAFETLESIENIQLQVIQQAEQIRKLLNENLELQQVSEQLRSENRQIMNRLEKLENLPSVISENK